MAYGTTKVDVIQSSTAGLAPQFNDGNGTQIGTLCRAWVNFNGTGTVAIRASFNVSSITDNGTGDYTVNFTNAMPDANYAWAASAQLTGSSVNMWVVGDPNSVAPTSSAVRIKTCISNFSNTDATYVDVVIFR